MPHYVTLSTLFTSPSQTAYSVQYFTVRRNAPSGQSQYLRESLKARYRTYTLHCILVTRLLIHFGRIGSIARLEGWILI
jgi:hypothetical protein